MLYDTVHEMVTTEEREAIQRVTSLYYAIYLEFFENNFLSECVNLQIVAQLSVLQNNKYSVLLFEYKLKTR
jgi:hypothetical protein